MDNQMTKEPIMIDGVDVAECTYYADGKCTNSQMIQSNCKNVAVCYYKEYKRKEQECEKWKNKLTKSFADERKKEIKIDFLKAELKRYKDMAKDGLDNYKDVGGCWGCGISFSFDELLKSYKKLEEQCSQLKQTLTEIKEIAENKLNWTADYKTYFKRDNKSIKQEGFKALAEILQKCEDVL